MADQESAEYGLWPVWKSEDVPCLLYYYDDASLNTGVDYGYNPADLFAPTTAAGVSYLAVYDVKA